MNKAIQRKPLRRFIILSTKFSGAVMYGFNAKGYLIEFQNQAWDIKDEQVEIILQHLGFVLTYNLFLQWVEKHGFTYMEIPVDLSFEYWYRIFDNSLDKKPARQLYEKLSPENKLYALWKLLAYKRYLERTGVKSCYPKTFLQSKLEDEHDKAK